MKLRAVCKVPNHSMFDEFIGEPSNKTIPDAAPGDENGPNNSDAVFDADCVGEAAAPKRAVTRLKFVWDPISEALTLVGAPSLRPTHLFDGCVAAAAPVVQSSNCFEK
jgi:hypothetical protein